MCRPTPLWGLLHSTAPCPLAPWGDLGWNQVYDCTGLMRCDAVQRCEGSRGSGGDSTLIPPPWRSGRRRGRVSTAISPRVVRADNARAISSGVCEERLPAPLLGGRQETSHSPFVTELGEKPLMEAEAEDSWASCRCRYDVDMLIGLKLTTGFWAIRLSGHYVEVGGRWERGSRTETSYPSSVDVVNLILC